MNEMSPNAIIVKDLLRPDRIIETHISYVFIKDEYVYKMKKAVNYGFLDFTLSQYRRSYCYLEKELNERFSKGVYLDLLKVVRKNKGFDIVPIENTLPTVEYLVKMRRLDDKDFFSTKLKNGEINVEKGFNIGRQIAILFKNIKTDYATAKENGSYEIVKKNCEENFDQTSKYVGKFISESDYQFIKNTTMKFLNENKQLFERRLENGYVIDGHGDLRAEHVYFDGDDIGLIDCIEFNKRFRYNDVVSDFVFLCMETDYMGYVDISDSLLSGFLSLYDDEDSKHLINFYKCYRAFVRFKVGCFMLDGKDESWGLYGEKLAEVKRMADLSLSYAVNMFDTKSLIFYGMIASGKSKNGKFFANKYAAKYLNSDVVRKEIAGVKPTDRVFDGYNEGLYSEEMTKKVYQTLADLANKSLNNYRMVVVDGSFGKKRYLDEFLGIFRGEPIKVKFTAPDEVIYQRLDKRFEKESVSDGRPEIYEKQKKEFEDIGADLTVVTIGEPEQNAYDIMSELKARYEK
ncbi:MULTISPECIES: AAA family ATPase [Calditerrivibrio]|uniref:bifunctional aminoglycoside phosphotransferase/ATP-binding protein n=1 Tax=Calditerrivibrio TaxID=545865 RepID=UPI003C76FDBC